MLFESLTTWTATPFAMKGWLKRGEIESEREKEKDLVGERILTRINPGVRVRLSQRGCSPSGPETYERDEHVIAACSTKRIHTKEIRIERGRDIEIREWGINPTRTNLFVILL